MNTKKLKLSDSSFEQIKNLDKIVGGEGEGTIGTNQYACPIPIPQDRPCSIVIPPPQLSCSVATFSYNCFA